MDNPQNKDLGAETQASAPPAPQEVKIRTMQSDLASMAASGGGLPQYANVRIVRAAHAQSSAASNSNLVSLIVAIVAALVLIVAGYFGYAAVRQHDAAEMTAGTTTSTTQ